MKTFVERYSWSEFQLKSDIFRVFWITRNNHESGHYQPYQIRANESLSQLCFGLTISDKDVSIDLYIRNLKLDFAIQVWETSQDLTKQRFPDYLEHSWLKTNDPIKELVFTSKDRLIAEGLFYQLLIESCNDAKIMSSERATFKRHEPIDYYRDKFQLEVWLNENKITDKIREKVYKQYSKGEKHYELNLQNQRFSFEEIKDYFVYCDSRLLGLLNASDGVKDINECEKNLFKAAENSDLDGIKYAVKNGANINAIDIDGETAFTKVFRNFNEAFYFNEQLDKDSFTELTISIAKKMLELGADINFFGYDGLNALQYTAYSHNATLMKFLLDNGANPNVNYFPEDGQDYFKSIPLETIIGDYHLDYDKDNLYQCETLLINAGAE